MKLLPALAAVLTALPVPFLWAAPIARCHDCFKIQASTWFEALQGEDGSWPADPGLSHHGAKGAAIPGRGTDSLAITAAMTLAMLGDANTVSGGRLRDQVRRAADHLTVVFVRSPDPCVLPPGGALALYVLAECVYLDREKTLSTFTLTRALDGAFEGAFKGPLCDGIEVPGSDSQAALEEVAIADLGWLAFAASVRVESGDARQRSNFFACVRKLKSLREESVAAAVFSLALEVRDARACGLDDLSHLQGKCAAVCRRLELAAPVNPALRTVLAGAVYGVGGGAWKDYSRRVLRPLTKRDAMTQLAPLPGAENSAASIAFWPWSGDPRGTLWDTAWNVTSMGVYFRYARLAISR